MSTRKTEPPALREGEVENGEVTTAFVARVFPYIPAEARADIAFRLNGFFSRAALYRRAEERAEAARLRARKPVGERIQELRDAGMSVPEAEVILFKEGYLPSLRFARGREEATPC